MPKYRKLHTKIVDSFDFAEMPDDLTRVMWILMIVIVDSQGRGIDSPSWINSRMFPHKPRDLSDIENSMVWLDQRGMIRRYVVNGRHYFDIPTFHEYQTGTNKEAASVIPSCPQVESKSEVSQELVKSKSASYTYTYTDSNTDTDTTTDTKQSPALSGGIFALYEQTIGLIPPKLVDELKNYEIDFPVDWLDDAFMITARNGKRNWSYTRAILDRWKVDGHKSDGAKGEKAANPDNTSPGVAYFDVGNERQFYQDGKLIRVEALSES